MDSKNIYKKFLKSNTAALYKYHTLHISIITRAQRAKYTFNHKSGPTQKSVIWGKKEEK